MTIDLSRIPHLDERRKVLAAFKPYADVRERERQEARAVTEQFAPEIAEAERAFEAARAAYGEIKGRRFKLMAEIEQRSATAVEALNIPSVDDFNTAEIDWRTHDDGTPLLCALTGLPIMESDWEFNTGNDEVVLMCALIDVDPDGYVDPRCKVPAAALGIEAAGVEVAA